MMKHFKKYWGMAAVIATTIFLYSQLPLSTALEFCSDESYETMKPLLTNQGYVLYHDIWNDEPPVLTVVLAAAFKLFGTSIFTARLVVAGFGILMIAVFHDMIRQRSGQWCALISTFLLISSPLVMLLSVSTMQEVPTAATGLFAAWLLFQWRERKHWAWLLICGAVMGMAIQIKLTAILLAPAIALEFALRSSERQRQSLVTKQSILNILAWSVGIASICMLVGFTWAKGSLEQSWKSHTSEQFVPGLGCINDHLFKPMLLQNHVECVLAAAAGVVLAIARKRGREIAFPVVLLLTDALVHIVHRPWWDYYYLHLAIPFAWLAGWAINEVAHDILRLHAKYQFSFASLAGWKQLVLCLMVAMVITRSELRLEWGIRDLRQRARVDNNPIVNKMKEYTDQTRFVYTEPGLYAFHAGFPVPPQLAEVTLKRFWSGQITAAEIVETCRSNHVEQILLDPLKTNGVWKGLLENYYPVYQDQDYVLFISKD